MKSGTQNYQNFQFPRFFALFSAKNKTQTVPESTQKFGWFVFNFLCQPKVLHKSNNTIFLRVIQYFLKGLLLACSSFSLLNSES